MIAILLLLGLAQDCPVTHVALTALDHASMEAAYVASFRGLYHRDPTGVPGSGPDDTGYWISSYDHYGAYSDNVCRAGWNAYTETRLSGVGSADPTLGDQAARFQPGINIIPAPPPPPVVSPPPVVPPPPVLATVDIAAILARLDALDAHITAVDTKFDAYEQQPPWLQKVFTNPVVLGVIGAVTSYYVGHQVAKP